MLTQDTLFWLEEKGNLKLCRTVEAVLSDARAGHVDLTKAMFDAGVVKEEFRSVAWFPVTDQIAHDIVAELAADNYEAAQEVAAGSPAGFWNRLEPFHVLSSTFSLWPPHARLFSAEGEKPELSEKSSEFFAVWEQGVMVVEGRYRPVSIDDMIEGLAQLSPDDLNEAMKNISGASRAIAYRSRQREYSFGLVAHIPASAYDPDDKSVSRKSIEEAELWAVSKDGKKKFRVWHEGLMESRLTVRGTMPYQVAHLGLSKESLERQLTRPFEQQAPHVSPNVMVPIPIVPPARYDADDRRPAPDWNTDVMDQIMGKSRVGGL